MQSFTSLDLQQRTGDVQRAAASDVVVITSHGKARSVMMSVEEFVRLKRASGETVALPRSRPVVRRGLPVDPLGYDTSDLRACALAMADDALNNRNLDAVEAEIRAAEKRFGMRP